MSLLYMLLIGGITGWLAGFFIEGKKPRVVTNISFGIGGAVMGGFAFDLLNFSFTGLISSLIVSFISAVILLFVVNRQ